MTNAGGERRVDVALGRAAPCDDCGTPNVFRDDAADRLDFVATHGGHAGLDLIDARRRERSRDGQLFARR